MKIKFAHPLWTHMPPVIALIILIIYIAISSPLPAEAPLQFGFNGEPNSYGSPWLTFGLTIGMSIFFIPLSIFLDNLWTKQEKIKTFNWLSLLDDIVVGALVGVNLGYLVFLNAGTGSFSFPWHYLLLMGGGVTILAIILEKIRPYHSHPEQLIAERGGTFKDALMQHLRDNASFVYWDFQNPFYVSLLTIGLPLILLVAAVVSWFSEPWASLLLCLVGVLLIMPHGGQRTMVKREDVTVRWGILGLKVLRLKTADIAGVEMHKFAPLKDFGGYGIRFNGEMKAYFMRGTRGILLTTTNGKKYLIGSDLPERLLMVLQGIIEAKN